VTADAEEYRQRMREKRDGKPPGRPKPATRQGDRFAHQNAVTYGGHLAKLKGRELAILYALNTLCGRDGTVRVSHTKLGEYTGMRREDASRTTKRLEGLGYIECVTRGRTIGEAGKRTANVYRLLTPPPISGAHTTNEGAQ
jgi:CRP-like cAMP-binding protein